MGLVSYSSSGSDDEVDNEIEEEYQQEEEEEEGAEDVRATKKRKVDAVLPPLPASFLDQYSSTVRTSTHDDPSLHSGRQRVIPHRQGNWPTHVYLEWHPRPAESKHLSALISAARNRSIQADDGGEEAQATAVHSLLESELGVPLPLHISLSRPLVLRTAQKDAFLSRLSESVRETAVTAFAIAAKDVAWHANESSTRCFLVLRLQTTSPLTKLLDTSNRVAREFQQPILYGAKAGRTSQAGEDKFHISIAWSLLGRNFRHADQKWLCKPDSRVATDASIIGEQMSSLDGLNIHFTEAKIRIGQDVHSLPFKSRRGS